MKDNHDNKVGTGYYDRPKVATPLNDKVLRVFTKLKRRSNAAPLAPPGPGNAGTPIRDLEPNFAELQQSAMNSYRLHSDVIKTENGFEVT